MYHDLLYSKDNHVVTITLNRPEQRNALSNALIEELVAAVEEFRDDDDARVLVLTGAGRSFCAGGDIKMMEQWTGGGAGKTSPDPSVILALYRDGIQRIPILLESLDKPVLAAINGAAAGAGCDLALMADIRIASEEARFGEVFCKLGIAPGDGGCYFLPRIVGIEKACELIFTGDIIDAREALRIGMVSRVVPAAELLPETFKLAHRIANGAILAIRYSKQAIYRGLGESLKENLEFIALAQSHLHATDDHAEGMQAFLEKREPKFKGR
jgi:enoyl-CoA hydratase/carnithine racemase